MNQDHVLGIDFGGTKIALAVAHVDKVDQPVGWVRLPTLASQGARQVVKRCFAAASDLVNGVDGLRAIGVSTFGVVRGDRVRLAPAVPGWEGLELPRLLHQEFRGTPVAIDNDVKAAASAELRWGALRGVSTGLYLNLGTGLASAMIVNGRVVSGAHGASGEIGYLLRQPGELGFSAGHAPLEEFISGRALGDRGTALLGRPVTASELFARGGDERVEGLLNQAIGALAMAVANLCVMIDPERVVVGGGMMGAARRIVPTLTAAVTAAVPFPPEIVAARFVDDAPLYGALALAASASGQD
ncbi:glucokinase [Sinosporangium album]|uniref:Glucokinase n=1 Tax=Sinosporangium album TaxID=504805 RepID=A0A1G8AVV5_9ACTN|nr:ROK family protein [Sinosporangium album]SDH25068.1 glucokinase [Sinosporangium album]